MKTGDCMSRENAPMRMTATDLFVLNVKRTMRNSLLLLGTLALSFLFYGRTTAQTLEAFDPNVEGGFTIYSLAVQSDGKTVIGGIFGTVGGAARINVARLNADGTLDASFAPNPNGTVSAVVVQPDGKILVGGSFTSVSGQTQNRLARFNADGILDAAFAPNPNGSINGLAIQPDGKILVGGSFTSVAGAPRSRIARLNSDGSLDNTFNAAADGTVNSFAVQPDGKIVIGGQGFAFVNGQERTRVARLNPDGTLDESFINPIITGPVFSVLQQPDGKILISGNSLPGNSVGNRPSTGLDRLNSNGSLDTAFNPAFVRTGGVTLILSLGQQADGKIFVSGSFDTVNGINRKNLVRLNLDGSVDESFAAVAFSDFSSTHLLLQPDGRILLSGSFTTVNGQARNKLARLTNPTPATQTLDITPQSVLLTRGGSAPELSRVTFERSSDGASYAFLGNAARIGATSNWILYANVPTGQNFIRARGYYFTGYFNASGSIAELIGSVALAARTPFDFDGDGKADVSVFRPSNAVWFLQRSQAGFAAQPFGLNTDKLAPADYDGDGKTDIAVFRNGQWYILQSSNSTVRFAPLGAAGDLPFPADYDADGRADLAVFQPSSGNWQIKSLVSTFSRSFPFGISTDKPVPADYDGDGRTDVAVFRAGIWYLLRSQQGFGFVRFGLASDKLVPADYDGDRRADIAVFRDGTWYISQTTNGQISYRQFGLGTDTPVPADYDGDGKTDVAVRRSGMWFLQSSTAGFSAINFGFSDDQPIPSTYIP